MRLIDADVLKEKFLDMGCLDDKPCYGAEILDRMPTVCDIEQQLSDRMKVERMTHADFKRYCTENNYVPLTTEMYSQAIKAMDALDKIRDEIEQERDKVYQNRQGCDTYYADGLDTALDIIDKYTKGAEK